MLSDMRRRYEITYLSILVFLDNSRITLVNNTNVIEINNEESKCEINPNSNVITFDGENYDMETGSCEFVLTQTCALDG